MDPSFVETFNSSLEMECFAYKETKITPPSFEALLI
jgi:hypothetical protein